MKLWYRHGNLPEIEQIVREADDIQHLELSENGETASLFARFVQSKSGTDPFWTVAQFHRDGRTLVAHAFWRLYVSDTDFSSVFEPLNLIQLLAKNFGKDYVLDGTRGSFFRNVTLKNQENDTFGVEYPPRTVDYVANTSVGRDSVTGVRKIILGYGIDTARYRDYLIKHGVPVKPPSITGIYKTTSHR